MTTQKMIVRHEGKVIGYGVQSDGSRDSRDDLCPLACLQRVSDFMADELQRMEYNNRGELGSVRRFRELVDELMRDIVRRD